MLQQGADQTIKDNEGFNALDYATAAGLRDLVVVLSEAKGISQKDDHGNTSLHQLVYNGQSETVKALLQQDNSNINEVNNEGQTPLVLAVQNSNIGIVEQLIQAGAKINISLLNGNSPLHYAAAIGNRFIAKLLIDNGANINALNAYSESPLLIAAYKGHNDFTVLLIEVGANLNQVDYNSKIAMAYASEKGCTEIVEVNHKRPLLFLVDLFCSSN